MKVREKKEEKKQSRASQRPDLTNAPRQAARWLCLPPSASWAVHRPSRRASRGRVLTSGCELFPSAPASELQRSGAVCHCCTRRSASQNSAVNQGSDGWGRVSPPGRPRGEAASGSLGPSPAQSHRAPVTEQAGAAAAHPLGAARARPLGGSASAPPLGLRELSTSGRPGGLR